jgi:hypothetical protein
LITKEHRKSHGEKDKEKKEADQQRQVTSYFKTVSVAGDKPSNVNLLKRPRDIPSGGSPSEENHYQNKKNKKNKRKKHQEDEKKKKENKRGQDTAGSLIIEVAEDSIHSTQSSAHQTPVSPVQARVKDRKSERGRLYLCSLYPHLRCLPPHHPRRSLVTRARYAFCR